MKNLIWLAILILVAVGVAGWGSHSWYPSVVPEVKVDRTVHISRNPTPLDSSYQQQLELPQVDSERLWGHLEALAGERYEDGDRDRTRNYLSQQLQEMGFSPVLQPFDGGVNLFAERKGTDPKAGNILVAAHYDTVLRSPGVDDNATGVAVVLEVARLFASKSTPRTLQVVLFDREELGLLGSLAFTGNKSHLKDLQGVIVLDMVGYACRTPGCQKYPEGLAYSQFLESAGVKSPDKGEFIAVVGDAEHLPLLNTFSKSVNTDLPAVVKIPVPLKGVLTPDVLRSDHAPFWYQGVGAVLVTDTANLRSPHYHQPTDSLATIDRPLFTGTAQVVVNATAKLLVGG
ncbi:M28 family peptidase [Kamptonema sp. UHCC 0994]|uniref:M28 family peptidase n=1 Tax=Kamptonema sp. UHCC 0994 TaxID=3031329 RepID=UPI0023B8B2FE|nr:M28 family peptidase [Kamptonema sp. UHCC 0994]MDF0555246.1 M28 family peptidase [Kamptonema sp. UHCC 0994]